MSNYYPRKTGNYFQSFEDEPQFEDFGITAEEYDKFAKGHNYWNTPLQLIAFIIAVTIGLAVGYTAEEPSDGFIFGWISFIILAIAAGYISEFLSRRGRQYRKAQLYRNALENFYKTKERYWMSLKGTGLESRIGDLYSKLGYKVEYTPRTDDEGIDLILKKGNKAVIVQCKGHKNPVGPAIVRELYGTLKSTDADSAILVSPAGFSRGAKQTAAGKDIQLISAHELIAMAKELE